MRILFLGDIVGRCGRDAVLERLPGLRETLSLDLVIVNAENASHGFGLSPDIATNLFKGGVDVITLGNHSWDRRDLIPHIDTAPRIIRPLNFPPGTPGNGSVQVELADGRKALVINVMGRLFMDPLDDPFRCTNELLTRHRLGVTTQAIVIDIHAEATSEKWAFGNAMDGRASLVVGTHTHTPTADHRILPAGTAFQTDAGMCGDYDSIIGMTKDAAVTRFMRKMPGERLQPATGEATICGIMVETDDSTGLARRVAPLRQGGLLAQTLPDFKTACAPA
ncbi:MULTISPECIES: TIGR00282 family metallophosphoesterase [Acetobacter]|uniref:TIGR00282 family metallophosphoesterase n=1 Tax=Acetobacter thailandicus TaxID=1502842 RepID=A0ABT3QH87_9PROT|nr:MULTISPECIES: TIGR00282 family metallophosphoesterase [Acetobacter]MBS0960838.1 TIGR00282 family metallophosphoesterase [Acetobacter thailandicus]MBS1003130.1 TIGR00282 family metallophosphoesterase [Acetobacter thailandicus]MCX2564645.1 TIGR00282 family metallophosphoesterase [Acetobacter thailandicus]NHN95889.1 TIGR00282 family metallophosphoesterase [Acetobacter thailandicus]OUI87238.1 metallophosphoesterase [Acetobacter sp. DmW_043]